MASPPGYGHVVTCGLSAEGASLDSGSHDQRKPFRDGCKGETVHTLGGLQITLEFIRLLCGGCRAGHPAPAETLGATLRLGTGDQVALL